MTYQGQKISFSWVMHIHHDPRRHLQRPTTGRKGRKGTVSFRTLRLQEAHGNRESAYAYTWPNGWVVQNGKLYVGSTDPCRYLSRANSPVRNTTTHLKGSPIIVRLIVIIHNDLQANLIRAAGAGSSFANWVRYLL